MKTGGRLFPCRCRKIFLPTRLVIAGSGSGVRTGRREYPFLLPCARFVQVVVRGRIFLHGRLRGRRRRGIRFRSRKGSRGLRADVPGDVEAVGGRSPGGTFPERVGGGDGGGD